MIRLFSWITSLLLSVAAVSMIVLQTADKTVLNAGYIQSQFKAVDGYTRFSHSFSTYVTEQTNKANPQLPQSQDISITVDAAKLRFAAFFDQLQPYLKGKNSKAVLDFNDIIRRSWIPAFPIPFDTATLQPLALPSSPAVQNKLRLVQTLKLTSIIATIVLLFVLLYLCYVCSRYRLLAGVLILIGLATSGIGLMASAVFGRGLHSVLPSTNIQSLTAIVDDLANRAVNGIEARLIITGVVIASVGVISYVIMRLIGKYRHV